MQLQIKPTEEQEAKLIEFGSTARGKHHVLTLKERYFTCSSCDTHQNRDLSAAISIARTGELDLVAAGIVARAIKPNSQQKSAIKSKVFELSKFAEGTEKKEAA